MDGEAKGRFTLTFALYNGADLIRREQVAEDIVKVGKDPRSHLRIDDELCSRMHAVIEVAGQHDVTLIDLGNEPGTLVNGQRVNKSKVRPGDEITVGGTRVVLESIEASPGLVAAASVPPAPGNPFASAPAAFASAPVAPPVTPPANPFAPAAANPFAQAPFAQPAGAPSSARATSPSDGPGASYALVKSGPAVPPDEVEVVHLSTVEVMVLWDTNVLHVRHLTPPRSFYVGESAADFLIPTEALGASRAPVVSVRGGGTAVIVPSGATGYLEIEGQGRQQLADLVASGRARPSSEVPGGHEVDLPTGAKARVELPSGIAFQVTAGNAGKPIPFGLMGAISAAVAGYFALSFLLHFGVIAAFFLFKPNMGMGDSEDMDRDQRLDQMRKYLNAAAERELEEKQLENTKDNADQKEGGTGTRAKGEEGSMGNPNSRDANKRYGVQGPKDNPDPHLARQAALAEAASFGMIGLLAANTGGDPNSPTAEWGREDSSGQDDKSARGNMFGDAIGDAFGAGGLGLTGTGEGGGGRGEGIGLGNFGGFGHGAGNGQGQGIGNGRGGLGRGHATKGPRVREGAASVNGRLPPEVIQRIVRQNFGRFRMCYENGLRNNPALQGRVAVRFVIDREGAVSAVSDGGSDIPDRGVASCVVRSFGGLSFPKPEGGIVTVVYPIVFSPGE
jgi:hypothetical protein